MSKIFVVTKVVLEKLRQKAKKLKNQQDIPHHQALEFVAKESGFDNWHQLILSANLTQESEKALYDGLIIAMDIKDAMDFNDTNSNFVEDFQIHSLVYDDFVESYKNSLDEGGNRIGDYRSEEQVHQIVSAHLENYTFYRFTGENLPDTPEDVIKLTSQISFWPPEFIWLKGEYIDTYSMEALDADGNITGVRF